MGPPSGGLGSALSQRVPILTPCLVCRIPRYAPRARVAWLIPALLPLALPARVAMAVALIAPFGLAMGMPFPRGLQEAGRDSLPAPPFFWGLNGIMSVMGSVVTSWSRSHGDSRSLCCSGARAILSPRFASLARSSRCTRGATHKRLLKLL